MGKIEKFFHDSFYKYAPMLIIILFFLYAFNTKRVKAIFMKYIFSIEESKKEVEDDLNKLNEYYVKSRVGLKYLGESFTFFEMIEKCESKALIIITKESDNTFIRKNIDILAGKLRKRNSSINLIYFSNSIIKLDFQINSMFFVGENKLEDLHTPLILIIDRNNTILDYYSKYLFEKDYSINTIEERINEILTKK
ncbi:hypothetical protein ACFL6G_06680 [candidate division KSB1 bacterium]